MSPIHRHALCTHCPLNRHRREPHAAPADYVLVRLGNTLHVIALTDIKAVRADHKVAMIYHGTHCTPVYDSLYALHARAPHLRRIHRNCLINPTFIDRVQRRQPRSLTERAYLDFYLRGITAPFTASRRTRVMTWLRADQYAAPASSNPCA